MIVWFTSKTELIQEEEKRSKQNIKWGDHKTVMAGFGKKFKHTGSL